VVGASKCALTSPANRQYICTVLCRALESTIGAVFPLCVVGGWTLQLFGCLFVCMYGLVVCLYGLVVYIANCL
jgi:hypothetical protein